MEKYDILNTITLLINSINDSKADTALLGNYTVGDLRELAVYLHSNYEDYPPKTVKKLLRGILITQCRLINQNFTWSDENKTRGLEVNEKLNQAIQEADEKLVKTFDEINKKMNNPDSFMKDFEVKINSSCFIEYNKDKDGLSKILENPKVTRLDIGDIFRKPEICSDESDIWKSEYFNGEFDSDYIGYAIQALLDTHIWSIQDIIEIETVWTDVRVVYQSSKSIEY